ncbi:MAG: hypothetical protein EU530_04465 [Promethearchaeota archaeon]|nr:MAG: hypothetical protein EU530_04465 [Candidatus Lokiarchaeota archaeon]
METTPSHFVKYENNALLTVCHIYKHEDGRILHLVPIIHTGDTKYYQEIKTYIGDKICLYENITVGSIEGRETTSNIIESIQAMEEIALNFDKFNKSQIKRLRRKYFTNDIRNLRRLVKKRMKTMDEKISYIFHQCERTAFDLRNLNTINASVAQILGLSFQYHVMDYVDDISKRKNWVHADVQMDDPAENFEEETIISSPNPEIIEDFQKRASLMYALLYQVMQLSTMSIEKGRDWFANSIITGIKQMEESEQKTLEFIPDLILGPRNSIVLNKIKELFEITNEIAVMYGAIHMIEIENAILQSNFSLYEIKEFMVFGQKK